MEDSVAVKTEQIKTKRTALKIGGMHCAGCVNSIQNYVTEIKGVAKCEVNLASEKAILEYDPASVNLAKIEKAIEEAGYKVVYEKLKIKLGGMSDSSDSIILEERLQKADGIRHASVNYGNGEATVEYNQSLLSLSDIHQIINKSGYQILSEDLAESSEQIEAKKFKRLFLVGLIFTIPVIIFSYPDYLKFIPFAGSDISAYVLFASASIVQFVTGNRFYVGAYRIARMKSANMDTLIVTGTTAAYLFSAFNTFPTPVWHNLYYDAAAVVITFITLGKFLENKTKGKASSIIRKMLELQPKTARIKKGDEEIQISIDLIKTDDILIVRPGERIPVDGIIIEGRSAVDESMVTGESVPVDKKIGEAVIGGTINKEGALVIRTTKVGNDTFLSQIVNLVEEAMGRKPAIQRTVDKVAGHFAFVVMAVAFGTFLAWYFFTPPGIHHVAASLIPAVAILVVACPCALGLATPTAIMVGMSKAAQNGVVFKGGESLEMLGKIKIAVFDKTGTLTQGTPKVTDIKVIKQVLPLDDNQITNNMEDNILKIAAIAEKNSEHPLAKSIVQRARELNLKLEDTSEFFVYPGQGIEATYKGHNIIVGNKKLFEDNGMDTNVIDATILDLQKYGKTAILVAVDKEIVGIIGLLDTPKPSARNALMSLRKMGIEIVMLTGDNEKTASTIAKNLSIGRVIANVMPSQKVEVIKQLKQQGKKVAMIGDGINDAAALTEADVGIAIGSGTDIALEAGSVVLVRDDLNDVVAAIEISRKTVSKVKQNLFYAFAYNAALIPVAGVGLLYPALAGLAMAASSVSVTGSSLLLKRWSPPSKKKTLEK